MSSVAEDGWRGRIGQRLQLLREERGLSQEEAGAPHFSASYIAAVERGDTYPSELAAAALAQRFDLPAGYFLATPAESPAHADLDAIAEDLQYQLDYANMLVHRSEVHAGHRAIDAADNWARPYLHRLAPRWRYRIPYLRGMAYLHQQEPAKARAPLETALAAAENDVEAGLRARNLLGVALYLQEQAREALEHHLECLHVLQQNRLLDPNFRLSVHRNLANDYLALNDISHAIEVYKAALVVLHDLDEPERRAGVYWGLSMAYRTIGDWTMARLHANQALAIYERAGNYTDVAKLTLNIAEILIEAQQYGEAAWFLARAERLVPGTDEVILLSTLYEHYANLARLQGDIDGAKAYIRRCREHNDAWWAEARSLGPLANTHVVRARAEVLHINALIEEAWQDRETADQLFQEAFALFTQTGFDETRYKIIYSYAETLAARGEQERAAHYHYEAKQYHRHR